MRTADRTMLNASGVAARVPGSGLLWQAGRNQQQAWRADVQALPESAEPRLGLRPFEFMWQEFVWQQLPID